MKTTEDSSGSGGERDNVYLLRLYVAGNSRRCSRARKNLQQICDEHLGDGYDLEIIDISKDPGAAERADIVAVPTLLKERPPPRRKMVGDLSRSEKVLTGLCITME